MAKPKVDKKAKLNIPPEVLTGLLTPSELQMLKNRWQIIKLLEENLSIRAIAKQLKVGTDTVVRVAQMRQNLPVSRIPFKTQTPWIFGKVE